MDSSFWYGLLQNIILLAVTAIAPALFALIVVIIRKKYAELKSYASEYGWDLDQFAELAVKAAEGMNLDGQIQDKKAYAIQIVQKQLDGRGIKLDISVIEAAVEAAVFSQFNKKEVK